MATLSQLIRVQLTRFAEALTKDEVSSICFIYKVPEGERERRQSAIEVFRYLEKRCDLDFSNPDQLIALMQNSRREKWARETKELIDNFLMAQPNALPFPVEESAVVLRPRNIAIQIRDKRKLRPIQSFSDLPSEAAEIDGPHDNRPSSCSSCNRRFIEVMESPDLAEALQHTIISHVRSVTSLSHFDDIPPSSQKEERELNTSQQMMTQSSDKSPFMRKGSTTSHKSTRSSGYGSMVFDNPSFPPDYPEQPAILLEEEQTDITSPTLSSNNGLDTDLLHPYTGTHKPPSRQSSSEDYFTADDASEGAIEENGASMCNTPAVSPCHKHRYSWESAKVESVLSPPPQGRETVIGSMELNATDLKKVLEEGVATRIYKSYPFPYLSVGQQYQMVLTPHATTSDLHYNLRLVMAGLPSNCSPLPSHISAQVCVYEVDNEDPCISTSAMLSSPINTFAQEISIQPTTPPTTSSKTSTAPPSPATPLIPTSPTLPHAASTTHHSLALFQNILNFENLAQVHSKTIVVKASLEYSLPSSS